MKNPLSSSSRVIEERLGRLKLPLYIGWTLTYRCNQRCLYCMIWKKKTRELTTREIFSIIEDLASMGTKVICFTGGEALLRDDIGKIIDFAQKKNINIDLNCNGSLVERKKSQIKCIRILNLSLDGPEKIHDQLRGRGSYGKVLKAASIAKQNKIQVYFRTVLSKLNSMHIDSVLNIASKFKTQVIFQPSTSTIYGTNLVNSLMPSNAAYRKTIDELIVEKKRGNKYIFGSLPVLEYLREWPKNPRMYCVSGKIIFGIKPNGMLYPCTWGRDLKTITGRSCLALGVEEAIRTLPDSFCDRCGNTSSVEFNYQLAGLLKQNISLANSEHCFNE